MIPASCHPDRPHQAKGLCSPCYDKQRFAADPEKRKQPFKRWVRKNKLLLLRRVKAWAKKNKIRRRVIAKRYQRKNLPKFALWQRNARKRNPALAAEIKHRRRAQEKSGVDCTAKIALLRLERFCRWCCCRLTPKNFSIDHIVALARGGQHVPENLAACCISCNASKGDRPLEEWTWQTN